MYKKISHNNRLSEVEKIINLIKFDVHVIEKNVSKQNVELIKFIGLYYNYISYVNNTYDENYKKILLIKISSNNN